MVESEGTMPGDREATVERKLRAIREAAKHEFPTAAGHRGGILCI